MRCVVGALVVGGLDDGAVQREEKGESVKRFRPTNFISDEADDLEEAIRIALRKSALDLSLERFKLRRPWHDYAPDAWRVKVEYAPIATFKRVQEDLAWIDVEQREDAARCERIISLLLDAMRSDVLVAARLIERIESKYEHGSIPREAVARFREECRA